MGLASYTKHLPLDEARRAYCIGTGWIKVADKNSSAVAYIKTEAVTGEIKRYSYILFCGKRRNHDGNYYTSKLAQRDAAIQLFFESVRKMEARQEKRKQERKAAAKKGHDLEVGDILYGTWGYDQTNVNFYQVIRTTKCTVDMMPLAKKTHEQTGWAQRYVLPDTEKSFDPDSVLKRRRVDKYGSVKAEYCSVSKWEGQPVMETSYA